MFAKLRNVFVLTMVALASVAVAHVSFAVALPDKVGQVYDEVKVVTSECLSIVAKSDVFGQLQHTVKGAKVGAGQCLAQGLDRLTLSDDSEKSDPDSRSFGSPSMASGYAVSPFEHGWRPQY